MTNELHNALQDLRRSFHDPGHDTEARQYDFDVREDHLRRVLDGIQDIASRAAGCIITRPDQTRNLLGALIVTLEEAQQERCLSPNQLEQRLQHIRDAQDG